MANDTKKNPLVVQSKEKSVSFLISILWNSANTHVAPYKWVTNSMNIQPGCGGIWPLIVGIRAANATIKPAMDWILLPTSEDAKNIPKLIIPNNHKGTKIVESEYIGILYMGILKCACLKQPIF